MNDAVPPPPPLTPPPPPPPLRHGPADVATPPVLTAQPLLGAPPPTLPLAAAEVVGLTKRYGSLFAVQNLTLRVEQGAVFGLIGPNGAGKSTTFSVWATLLKPTAGQARVHGLDPVAHPRDVRKLVGYMPDVLGVYDSLRVDEYLEFFAHSYRIPRKQWKGLVEGLLELVDLGPKRDSMVNSLSRGMKQRLSLARALVHDPKLLILDEPASGLDPRARIELRELLAELKAMGKTIVISSHILSELEAICTDIAILEAGRLLAAGTPASIRVQLGSNRTIDVRFADGTTEQFAVSGDDEQRELLQRLVVDQGRSVVEFRQSSGGLEDIFLQLTEGIVQ